MWETLNSGIMLYVEQILKESKIEKIDERITRFVLGPDNWCTYLIEDRRNVLIDASYPVVKPLVDARIDAIAITHTHFDHIAFTQEIIEANRPKVYASKEAAAWLERYKHELIPKKYNGYEPLRRWKTPAIVNPFEITDFVKDGDIISTGNLSLRVIEMPGHHCPGEICLYEKNKGILFSGDVWFGDEIYGSSKFREGNEGLLKDSIKILKTLKVKILLPGHIV